jgi:hypothetical protein
MHTSRFTRSFGVLAVGLLLAACSDREGDKKQEPQLPDLGAALPNLILPANASFVSKSGSSDVLSVLLRAPGKPEAVVAFYRSFLNPPAWRLVSEGKDNAGAYVLYAEQKGPPLWIRVWPDSEFNGTFVRLTGAVASLRDDSATGSVVKPGPIP